MLFHSWQQWEAVHIKLNNFILPSNVSNAGSIFFRFGMLNHFSEQLWLNLLAQSTA